MGGIFDHPIDGVGLGRLAGGPPPVEPGTYIAGDFYRRYIFSSKAMTNGIATFAPALVVGMLVDTDFSLKGDVLDGVPA